MVINLKTIQEKISQLETEMQKPEVLTDSKKMSKLGREYNEAKETFALAED